MRLWGWAAAAAAMLAGSADATALQFSWVGTVNTIQVFNTAVDPVSVGDPIAVSFIYDDATRGAGVTLVAPGGGTDTQYNVTLQNLQFKAGSYSYTVASQAAYLSYRNDSFGQDLINFFYHIDFPGGRFDNPQLIAQGPQSILASASASVGFPYVAFPTIRTVFGSSDGRGNSDIVFGNLAVTVATVPEPATWAMMILGMAAVGLAARRRAQSCSAAISRSR